MNNRRIPWFGSALALGAVLTLGSCSSNSSDATIVSAESVAAGADKAAEAVKDAVKK